MHKMLALAFLLVTMIINNNKILTRFVSNLHLKPRKKAVRSRTIVSQSGIKYPSDPPSSLTAQQCPKFFSYSASARSPNNVSNMPIPPPHHRLQ